MASKKTKKRSTPRRRTERDKDQGKVRNTIAFPTPLWNKLKEDAERKFTTPTRLLIDLLVERYGEKDAA